MSYRSFKRVLGETNMERKCLVLFGACLFLLITGAFWYAEQIAERLVKEKTNQTGRDFVDLSLLRYHVEYAPPTKGPGTGEVQAMQAMMRERDRDLLTQDFKWEILVLDKKGTIDQKLIKTRTPSPKERATWTVLVSVSTVPPRVTATMSSKQSPSTSPM